jgi:hypothetical protein
LEQVVQVLLAQLVQMVLIQFFQLLLQPLAAEEHRILVLVLETSEQTVALGVEGQETLEQVQAELVTLLQLLLHREATAVE